MDKIYYLGFYDTVDNIDENRNICLAATGKMTYILSVIEEAGFSVEIVSPAKTSNNKTYGAKTVDIGKQSKLVLFKTLPWGSKIQHVISLLFSKLQLILYILKHINKDDVLVAYHSIYYAKIIHFLKKIKKFKLILEVEEIYFDVSQSKTEGKAENTLFNDADTFIFPTEFLTEKVNKSNKPYTISYGTYTVEHDRKCKFNDGKIHIVYAGTFDPRKGGAQASLSAVPYLTSDYHMHIIGFGDKPDVESVLHQIDELSKTSMCELTYDGMLTGEDYIRFIQSCDIGLSTQNPEGKFNDSSFPSKILSYLANGLHVVSIKIPVVEKSKIGPMIHFYDKNSGKDIASAITEVNINSPYNSREMIKELNSDFVSEMKKMLENLQ